MSYYILPKIETELIIKPSLYCSRDNLQPYISQSLIKYINESHFILEQQLGLDINKGISIKMLNQIVHTYDFLFSVVTGTTSSICSIQVDNAIFFDPKSPEDMAKQIFKLAKDQNLQTKLITKGLRHVKKFSWEKMAKETLKVYNEVLTKT